MTANRILFLDQYGEMGGGQTVLLSLVQAARSMSAEITILAPGGGALQQAIAARFGDKVAFHACAEPRLSHGRKSLCDLWALLAYGWAFRRHLKLLRRQDVIYINGLRHLPHMLALSLFTQARMICHLHLDHAGTEKALIRVASRWPHPFHLVTNSRFVSHALGTAAGRVTLIENALDQVFAAQPFQDRFRDRPAVWTSAVIGTLRPEKGQDAAISAVSSRNDMILHIIGRDGDGAGAWVARLKAKAPARILFDGPASNIPGALDALHVKFSLVPSRWEEPFGLVAIESMACSCITIVSGRGGLAEIAERTGALVARDGAELASILARLCEMPPSALSTMARGQYEATQRHYAPARFETQVQALLTTAFTAGGAPL